MSVSHLEPEVQPQPDESSPELIVSLKRHIPGLDAMRGIAVAAVMVAHLGGGLEGPAASGVALLPAIDTGARGVDLFFVLSGFLITGILFDARGQNRFFTNFYARWALRIFPLYYAVLLATLVIWPGIEPQTTWQRPAMEYAPSLWLYSSNLLIAWKGKWCLGAFDHLWSLAVEEQFYLAWPFIIAALSRRRAMAACGLCSPLLSAAACYGLHSVATTLRSTR